MPELGYDIDRWDRWVAAAVFALLVVFLGWRFHIATPIDEDH